MVASLAVDTARAAAVQFWHPWPHAEKSVRTLAAKYSRSTGTTIQVRAFNPNSYKPWSAEQRPDLIGLYRPTKRGVENLVKAGRLQDLQREMGSGWYVVFSPNMLETFTIRGEVRTGVYGVPLTGQVHLFVYNKALFRKARIEGPPSTWSELMSYGQRLRKIGVTPYAGGFGSNSPPLAAAYERSYLGLHKLSQTYFGRYPYTSRDWIQNLSLYPEMRRRRFTDAASASMSGVAAIKSLLDGRVAMVFTDPSFESIRGAYKPVFASWGVFGAPVDDRAPFLPRLPGGIVEGVVVSSRSPRKAQAIAFARWLTQPDQQIALANGASSIPATSEASSSPRLRPHLRTFASVGMRDQAIDMRIYENPRVLGTFYSGVRRLLAGSGTPSAVARQAQAARKR